MTIFSFLERVKNYLDDVFIGSFGDTFGAYQIIKNQDQTLRLVSFGIVRKFLRENRVKNSPETRSPETKTFDLSTAFRMFLPIKNTAFYLLLPVEWRILRNIFWAAEFTVRLVVIPFKLVEYSVKIAEGLFMDWWRDPLAEYATELRKSEDSWPAKLSGYFLGAACLVPKIPSVTLRLITSPENVWKQADFIHPVVGYAARAASLVLAVGACVALPFMTPYLATVNAPVIGAVLNGIAVGMSHLYSGLAAIFSTKAAVAVGAHSVSGAVAEASASIFGSYTLLRMGLSSEKVQKKINENRPKKSVGYSQKFDASCCSVEDEIHSITDPETDPETDEQNDDNDIFPFPGEAQSENPPLSDFSEEEDARVRAFSNN